MIEKQDSSSLLSLKLWSPAIIASCFLIIVAQYSFLTFHTLAELFAIIVSFVMFAFAWTTRYFIQNSFLLFLACGYFWIGSLDLLHTLTYKGMNLLVHDHGNTAINFWIGTRYFEACVLLFAPLAAGKKINAGLLFSSFAVISLMISALVFSGRFPTTFIEGQGLTTFKIYSEYFIDLILLVALFHLFKTKESIPQRERHLIAVSIVLTMLAELAFTFYVSVYGLSNLIGHLFKLASFWLIFNAIISSNLKKPYADLQRSENRFRRLFENSEVSLWNVDLSGVYSGLATLKRQGVTDLRKHLSENRDITPRLADTVHITEINSATYNLFSGDEYGDFKTQSEKIMRSIPITLFIDQLLAIWNGDSSFRAETTCPKLDGTLINTVISFQLPDTAEDFASVPVSIIDITKHKKDEQRIWQQANFDELTGLANRSYFSDSLSHAIDLAERHKDKLALLYLDLDRFKQVNDTLGHAVGDQLLQEAAKRLTTQIRKSDIAARLAGDEFAVILQDVIRPDDIEPLIRQLLASLSRPYTLSGHDAFVSASIGIALFPDDGDDVAELLRKADSAMYKAKEDGRNNYHFFTEEIEREAQRKRKMETDLFHALQNSEFTLHYQPIQNLNSEVVCAEALIRWHSPEKGVVSPAEFIPFAEELNLIAPIGEWVLREACKQAASWTSITPNPPRVAVNLSCRQFQLQHMPTLVEEILTESGLGPDKLTLEITESLMIDDDESTLEQLQALRALGVDLAVDDFGTGYSSLSYLKKFPVSYLKIDRSFVRELPDSQEDAALIKAIMSMAQSLNLEVIAEGVETPGQAAFLQSRNCTYVQGFFLSKPLPSEAFEDYLKQNIESLKQHEVD